MSPAPATHTLDFIPDPISPSRLPEHDPPFSPSLPPPPYPFPTAKKPPSSPMAAERASPSSDSSSQSGMADNETEPEPSQHSGPSASQASSDPPKKKRTRTLTTPHQSAVLQALLAKSRFPTTTMREEVGREIGLSARKVQIWFQNQRQKARRPQSESGPLTRPPQFGPFPIMTNAGPSPASRPSPSTCGPPSEVSPGSARSAGSFDFNPPLSGPAIPTWSPTLHQRRHSSAEERNPLHRPSTSPRAPQRNSQLILFPRSSDVSYSLHSHPATRGLAPHHVPQATHVETSPLISRVLPPIIIPRSSVEPCPFPPSRTSANHARHHEPSVRSPVEPGGSPTSPLTIPPPFALQPRPQWDPQTFTPFTPPEFASWSHPSGSVRSSFSARDRVPHEPSPRGRHFYTSSEPRPSGQSDPPLAPHPIPPRRHLTSASPFSASPSGHARARSEDEAGEA